MRGGTLPGDRDGGQVAGKGGRNLARQEGGGFWLNRVTGLLLKLSVSSGGLVRKRIQRSLT